MGNCLTPDNNRRSSRPSSAQVRKPINNHRIDHMEREYSIDHTQQNVISAFQLPRPGITQRASARVPDFSNVQEDYVE